MCFSATASFTAAAVLGAVGAVTLGKAAAYGRALLPLAAFPVLFAAQQAIEGFLWLELPRPEPGPLRPVLVHMFQAYAEVLWPVFAPLAALVNEPIRWRRWAIGLCLAVGAGLALFLLIKMIQYPYFAFIAGGHILYRNDYDYPTGIEAPYIVATVAPLLLSSGKAVQLLGIVVLIAFAASFLLAREAYISVWCFFAAIASVMVYLHVNDVQHGAVPQPS
jgi:hypothetical protein